jgi:hypothetical protein
MNKLELRLRRLEVKHGACNHRPPHGLAVTLNNPTDEEIQEKEKELAECPSCQRNGTPDIYVRSYYIPRSGRAQITDDTQG